MRKFLLAMLSIIVFSTYSIAAGWGVGVKIGAGENDPKGMEADFDYFGGSFTKAYGVFAIEGLYEWDLEGEQLDIVGSTNKLGLSFGIEGYAQNKLNTYYFSEKENTVAIPVTLYYKKDLGIKNFNYYAGAGVTFINTNIDMSGFGYGDIDKSKVFPHITIGAEYRFTKLFALGLDLKYNIAAKVKKHESILSDHSGIHGALAARFYF